MPHLHSHGGVLSGGYVVITHRVVDGDSLIAGVVHEEEGPRNTARILGPDEPRLRLIAVAGI